MSLWCEQYRPQTLDECILPLEIKKSLKDIVSKGDLPHLLLSGPSGNGKTSTARAICNELGAEYLFINGSEDSGIDVLRNRIRQFASTYSLQQNDGAPYKVVILDECDFLQANSTQPALRSFMEEFAKTCRFILTCNFKNRIIPALHSRCTCIDFKIEKTNSKLLLEFHRRLEHILKSNEISYDPKLLASVIARFAPDWRRVLNECQRYSMSGELSPQVLAIISDDRLKTLMTCLKDKNFKKMRAWCSENIDNDVSSIFRKVFDALNEYVEPSSIPICILVLADYQYKSSFVVDQEINLVACFTEIMRDAKFK